MRSNLAGIGPEAGLLEGGPGTAKRARKAPGVPGVVVPGPEREGVAQPTHSGPCRAYGARSAGWAQRGGWLGSTPV